MTKEEREKLIDRVVTYQRMVEENRKIMVEYEERYVKLIQNGASDGIDHLNMMIEKYKSNWCSYRFVVNDLKYTFDITESELEDYKNG